MCYELLQPYPQLSSNLRVLLTLLADLIIKQLDEQPGRRKKRKANWRGASYPAQIPAFGKNTLLSMLQKRLLVWGYVHEGKIEYIDIAKQQHRSQNTSTYGTCLPFRTTRGRPLTLEGGVGGVGDFEKKIPASACRKEKIACSTNVIESLWEKKGKKNILPTTLLEKKFFMTRNDPSLPLFKS